MVPPGQRSVSHQRSPDCSSGIPAPPGARDPDCHGGMLSSLRTRDARIDAASPTNRAGVALAIMLSAQLMIILDATVVNIALPHILTSLHFTRTSLSWVMNGYTLTFGGLLLLGGRAGDILGRRRVFLAGIALFTLASLVGGLSTSAGMLLAARAAQGVGGALAAPAVLALIVSGFPGPGADSSARHLHGCDHRRVLAGPGARGRDHRMAVLALGPVHQRADRDRRSADRAALRGRDPAPGRPLRPGRRGDLHRRRGLGGVRIRPGRGQRLG